MISKTNTMHLTALALLASAAAAAGPAVETTRKPAASVEAPNQGEALAAVAFDVASSEARLAPVSSKIITGPVDPLRSRQIQEDIRRAGDRFGKGNAVHVCVDESVLTPVRENSESHSAQTRDAAIWRQALRDAVKWEHLDSVTRRALAPYFVGDDQLDDRGVSLVTFAWSYTPAIESGSNRQGRDATLNVEGDLVIVGDRTSPNERILATEVSGTANATQGWTQNWNRNFGLGGGDSPQIRTVATSLYGNTYLGGAITGSGANAGRYLMTEFSGVDGTTIGSIWAFTAGGNARADGIAVDPIEEYVYVCGRGGGTYAGGWLARHRPDAAKTRDWIVAMPWGGGGNPTVHDPLKINRYGEIFVAGENAAQTCLTKFNPVDGSQDWTYISTDGSFAQAVEIDFDGNPYVTSLDDDGNGWITRKFDRLTGAVLWTATEALGNPQDLAIDNSGNVYVCGSGSVVNTFMVRKYNSAGVLEWSEQYGTTGVARRVALDRLGNPYVAGHFSGGNIDVRKFNPFDLNGGTGAQQVWAASHSPEFTGAESNSSAEPVNLDIDANGSVYVSGTRTGVPAGGGSSGQEFFVIKWEQPFEFVPQIKRSNPTVRMEKRSLWSPTLQDDLNNAFPGLSNIDFTLFSFPLQPIVNIVNYATYLQVTYGVQGNGLTQGGAQFGFNRSDASLGVGFQSSITGGTFDASAKGELVTVAPPDGGTSGLSAGDPIPLIFDWTPSPKRLELIANNTPRLTAAIVSKAVGDMTITARAHDTTLGTILGDTAVLSGTNLSRLDNKPIISVDTNQLLEEFYDWYDFRSGDYPQSEFANAQFRLPRLRPSASYDANAALLKSTISEKFVKGRVNITNIISFFASGGRFVPSVTYYDDSCCHTIDFYVGILQAYFRGDIAAEQDLTLELRPYVKLATDQNGTVITIPLARTGTPGNYTYTASYSNANLTLPNDGNIEITPTFGMKAVLTNRTGLRFGLYAGFEPVDIDINARAAGIDLANIDTCLGCIEQDLIALVPGNSRVSSALNGGKINLFNQNFPEFTFPNEVVQSTFTVTGDVNNQPQLSGFSRAFAPMIIYNQRNPPNPLGFASGLGIGNAAGNVPMVAYGAKFTSTTPNLKVRISHQGRTADLTYTRLNDNSLLVQLPRYFLVVPGVAQIWVQNNNGSSKAVDFPIVYPAPNFAGLSATIWAGDPRWSADGETVGAGLVAVDGGTPAGYDTWIARRDYYRFLRQSIWNGSTVFGVFQSSADVIFPAFAGWELGTTKSPPDFPTLVALNGPTDADDVPLSLFRQASPLPEFNNDGYFRSNLQPNLHTQAGFLDFVVVNPGPYPGGGESRVRTIEVPAPKPVISEIYPPFVQPGSVPAGQFLRLDVRGPDSVPFFNGYENAKFGNFTSDSVVRIGNTSCTTEFVNAGLLVALIPADQLNSFSNKIITVSTPSNGTDYAEERRDGSGTVVFSGSVNSGGTSDPMVLEVAWPAPVINGVGQSVLTLNTPPVTPVLVNGEVSDGHNFSITGTNFAPGCTMSWNGVAIPFTRVSDTVLRTTITASLISSPGVRRLEVSNPAPNARTSNTFLVQVTQPPAATRTREHAHPER